MSYEWVSDPDFITDIYTYVKNCARILPSSVKNIQELCAIDISKNVPSRFVECQPSPPDFKLSYHEEDITIYGGAALQLYDFRFDSIKPAGFGNVSDFIGTKTNDIDMVWWPRSSTDKYVATARSPGIKRMCEEFKTMLFIRLIHLKRVIEPKLGFKPEITIGMFDSLAYGAYTITITFAWGKHTHRVCEISIHDSASSQHSPTLQHMTHDIVHMTNDDTYPNHKIQQVTYNPQSTIALPNYAQFIQQQFFALHRLLFQPDGKMAKDPARRSKGMIVWRRMVYMKELLKATYNKVPFDPVPLVYQIDQLSAEVVRNGKELGAYCRELGAQNYAVSMLCSGAQIAQPHNVRKVRQGRKGRKTRKNRKN